MELASFIIVFLIVGGVIAGVSAVSKGSIEDLRKMQEYRNFQQNQYQQRQQNPQNIADTENNVSVNPEEQEQQQNREELHNRIEPVSVIPPKPEFLQSPLYTFQQPVKIKPEKKRAKLPASAVMLIIGTVFIILSALTFVVANWVKFEPIGRVGALAGSAVLAFMICVLMKFVAGLERTSGAFYTIGTIFTSISFLTAGYYGLMGKWLSPDGNGAFMLYSLLSLLIALSFFISYPIYKKTACHYAGFGFISSAVVLGCIQTAMITDYTPASSSLGIISLMLTAVGAVFIAVFHIIKPFRGTVIEKPMYLIGDISAVTYTFSAVIYDIFTIFRPESYVFINSGIIIAQLILYGFLKKQKWTSIFVNIFTAYLITAICFRLDMDSVFSTRFIALIFGIALLILYVVNRVIPRNYTFSRVITLISAVFGAITSMAWYGGKLWILHFIAPVIVSVAIAEYALHKRKSVQITAGLFAPVLPFITANFLLYRLEDFMINSEQGLNVLVFGMLSLIYMASAGFFIFLPKINFRLHASCPERSDVIIYVNMAVSAVILFCLSLSPELFAVTAGLIVINFIMSHMTKNNIIACISVASGVILTYTVSDGYFNLYRDTVSYIMFMLFAVLMAVSRIVFPEGFRSEKNGKKIYDVFLISAWTALLPMSMNRTAWFLRFISMAIFFAVLVKRNTKKKDASVLFSVSATIASFAFMIRPFLNPDESMIRSKITLGIIFLLGVAYRIIWRDFPNISKNASTFIFIISFIGLMIDGIIYDNAGNRIFVLAVTSAILIWSFFIKSKTWFIVSSTALVIITAVSTFRYFNKAGWWIYLLIVGAIFIFIATVNEICRKKGGTVKSELLKHFSDWNW